jgi:hypothetical protein
MTGSGRVFARRLTHLDRSGATLSWYATLVGIGLAAFALRLLIIAHSHGGDDLRIYTYFSRLALHGLNPFAAPANGPISPAFSNSPPVEVAAFAGLLAIHDSPTTLRVAFALSDVMVLLLIGFRFPRPRRWRIAFMLFYAFNPLVLVAWTVFAEDKTLLFLGIVILLLSLERGREWAAWMATMALTAFKFLGAFVAPALALHSFRLDRRRGLMLAGAFVAVFLLSNLPWFPKSLDAFSRRDHRLGINPPGYASPTLLLSRLGVYAPLEVKIFTAAAILTVLALFLSRRVDAREAVVWSLFGGYAFLPDDAIDRLLLMTLPFMLILDLSPGDWIAIWLVSAVAALAAVVAERGVPHELAPIAGPLRAVFGAHGSTARHVLWMNVIPALVLLMYFRDRRTRTHHPADHGEIDESSDAGSRRMTAVGSGAPRR